MVWPSVASSPPPPLFSSSRGPPLMDCFPHSRCLACAPDDHWELPCFPSPRLSNLRNNQRLLSLHAVPPRLFRPYCVIFLADTPGRFLPRDNREDLRQCLSFWFPVQEAETRGIYTATGSFCQRANMHDCQPEAHGAGSRFQGGGGVTGSQIAIRWACKRSAAGERLLREG